MANAPVLDREDVVVPAAEREFALDGVIVRAPAPKAVAKAVAPEDAKLEKALKFLHLSRAFEALHARNDAIQAGFGIDPFDLRGIG
jgi:hypothetical protein